MIIGEVSTEQTTENAQNPNSGSNSGAACDPGKTGKTMELLRDLIAVECIGWAKAAGTSMRLAIIAINMATHGEQDKMLFTAKTGSLARELPREAVKIEVANGAAMVARDGTAERFSEKVVQTPAVQWEHPWKGLQEEDGRDPSADHRPAFAQKDSQMECHAGGDGRRRGELGTQRQQNAKPFPFNA